VSPTKEVALSQREAGRRNAERGLCDACQTCESSLICLTAWSCYGTYPLPVVCSKCEIVMGVSLPIGGHNSFPYRLCNDVSLIIGKALLNCDSIYSVVYSVCRDCMGKEQQ
jgi:hypothetical protein